MNIVRYVTVQSMFLYRRTMEKEKLYAVMRYEPWNEFPSGINGPTPNLNYLYECTLGDGTYDFIVELSEEGDHKKLYRWDYEVNRWLKIREGEAPLW